MPLIILVLILIVPFLFFLLRLALRENLGWLSRSFFEKFHNLKMDYLRFPEVNVQDECIILVR